MSVKSTVELTRRQAEERYWDLLNKLYHNPLLMSDHELENILEYLNDKDKGGEGFENYRIVDDKSRYK